MRNRKMIIRTIIATTCIALAGTSALAQTPKSLGEFKNWTAWSYDGKKGKVCYVHAIPTSKQPDSLKHGDVSFFIRKSPGEGVTNEANFVVGYPFQDNSTVIVDIDGRKFTMFTQEDSAWILNSAEEPELVAAMRAGSRMTVTGKSRRGNETTYSYSLSGVTAATNKITTECK